MKVLIAGLSDPSATAMERVVVSVFPGARVLRQQRGVGLQSPDPWSVARRCDLCIVDLIGLGLARWTAERLDQLQSLVLGEHSAVVLAPPGDGGGWLEALPALQANGGLRVLLQHPLRASTMRKVLGDMRPHAEAEAAARAATSKLLAKAARPAQPSARPVPAAAPAQGPASASASATPRLPARLPARAPAELQLGRPPYAPVELRDVLSHVPRHDPRATQRAAQGAVQRAVPAPAGVPSRPAPVPARVLRAAPATARRRGRLGAPLPPAWDEAPDTFSVTSDEPAPASAPAAVVHEAFGLTQQAFDALLAACPEAGQNAYLQMICTAALKGVPQEFQIGSHSGVVVHSAQNWVASNISSALRKRLTAHAMMLQIVESRPLQEDEAFTTAARLFGRRQDGRRPLDTFVWGLVYSTFEAAPPLAQGDLRLQLRRFPNFTRMAPQPDLFIQLALLCARAPHSIDELVRIFARHDPRLVTLFAMCAILSGSASVLPARQAAEATPPAAPVAAAAAVADAHAHSVPPAWMLPPAPRANLPGLQFIRALLKKLF